MESEVSDGCFLDFFTRKKPEAFDKLTNELLADLRNNNVPETR